MKLRKLRFAINKLIIIGPPLIAFFVCIIYMFIVLIKFNKDTTPITNAAFAIVSVLSGLSFGTASVVSDEKVKDRFVYCGERFFHAAILLILASVLKYAALSIGESAFAELRQTTSRLLTIPLSFFVQLCFLYAILDIHTGINIANKQLWQRLNRSEDWDSIV